MTSYRTETETVSRMEKAGQFDSLQPSVSDVTISLLVSGLMVDIFSTFCDGFMVHCVQLMLSKFLHLQFLLFNFFVAKM